MLTYQKAAKLQVKEEHKIASIASKYAADYKQKVEEQKVGFDKFKMSGNVYQLPAASLAAFEKQHAQLHDMFEDLQTIHLGNTSTTVRHAVDGRDCKAFLIDARRRLQTFGQIADMTRRIV